MSTAGSTQNGKTVWLRFKKACETCHTKYGAGSERAMYAIAGIAKRQFGDEMTLLALREILVKGEFWKLDIQSQRAQHMRAVEKTAAVDEFDILIGRAVAASTSGAASYTHQDMTEVVPF